MANVSVTKEILWRQSSDEFGIVHVQKVTRIVDDEGGVTERLWRQAVTPDDDISGFPARLRTIISAARYPEAVARYEAMKAARTI